VAAGSARAPPKTALVAACATGGSGQRGARPKQGEWFGWGARQVGERSEERAGEAHDGRERGASE
jgi:hypothetical protein